MDIERINDFLLEQVTGLTRVQIEQDVAVIKDRRAEVKELEAKITQLTASIQVETERDTELRHKTDCLTKILAELEKQHKALETEYNKFVVDVPMLRAESYSLTTTIESLKTEYSDINNRIKRAEELESENAKNHLAILKERQELEQQKRDNTIDTIKVKEALSIVSEKERILKINGKPSYVYLREIQALIDKKGIKLNILKELGVL